MNQCQVKGARYEDSQCPNRGQEMRMEGIGVRYVCDEHRLYLKSLFEKPLLRCTACLLLCREEDVCTWHMLSGARIALCDACAQQLKERLKYWLKRRKP